MKRLHKILVVRGELGGSDPSVRLAALLAQRDEALVTVVDAVEPVPARLRWLAPPSWEVPELLLRHRNQACEDWVQLLRRQGVRAESRMLQGSPAAEIARLASKESYDLVLKTVRQANNSQAKVYSSLAASLVRNCTCPVWISPPAARDGWRRVMAAIGPEGPRGSQRRNGNRLVLQAARDVAQRLAARLYVVRAWEPYAVHLLHKRLPGSVVQSYVDQAREQSRRELVELLKEVPPGPVPVHLQLLRGEPEVQIPTFASRIEADLLVMGTPSRSGLARLLVGTTGEDLQRRVGCGILSVHAAEPWAKMTSPAKDPSSAFTSEELLP